MEKEKVMVVPSGILEKHLSTSSFVTDNIDDLIDTIIHNYLFVDRDYAETAKEYKQIIPYAVLLNGDQIYRTKRLKKQTEKRLHGLCSIGQGGHINPREEHSKNIIEAGMRRELLEEVGLNGFEMPPCKGIINDLSTEVSNYHLGLLYPVHITCDIKVHETEKMIGSWATKDDITNGFDELESWSKIAWENRHIWDPSL